jgi:hypothetical protein
VLAEISVQHFCRHDPLAGIDPENASRDGDGAATGHDSFEPLILDELITRLRRADDTESVSGQSEQSGMGLAIRGGIKTKRHCQNLLLAAL